MNNIAKAASSRHRKLRPELRHDIDLFDFAREREGLQTKPVRHIARFRDRRAAEWGRAMTTNKKPGPRANAGNRANPKVGQGHIRGSAVDWEADPAAIWFARRFHADDACACPGRAGEPRGGLAMNGPIDLAAINRAALAAFLAVLARILPGGKRVGAEIVALNPRRADRRLGSFKVNRYNGRWADFATGDKGSDPVSQVAYLANVSQAEAARLLARMLGLEGRRAAR